MARSTGSPRADAESDFLRARRRQVLSSLASWIRSDGFDRTQALSLDEVVQALGRRGEHYVGARVIPIDAIVGSVDKARDFDRRFRPTSGRSRERWERLARASRTGEVIPPIDVYQLGDYYFVRDGHHRVSVARTLGLEEIEAFVTKIDTFLSPTNIGRRRTLESKHWRRVFLERVPLAPDVRDQVRVRVAQDYGRLAEMVEAWCTRIMHAEQTYIDKPTMAARWFSEEFTVVCRMIEEAHVRGDDETNADAYMRVAAERYRLIREHAWDADVLAQVKARRRLRS